MSGLEGIRVLELGELVSAPFTGKLLADLGADVVKVEHSGGDSARRRGPFPGDIPHPEKSGTFLALNTNKRSVELDLASEAGQREFRRLLCCADILIHNFTPRQAEAFAIEFETLRALRPSLVMCSITSFGLTGPYRNYRAEEITLVHGGGWAFQSPGASDRPDDPPLKPFGHQAHLQAGLAGAMTTLAAYYRAQRTGIGEHIDLSAQSYVATILEAAMPYYTYPGLVATRKGQRGLNPWGIYTCRDGLIFVATIEQDQWERLVELMGHPEWAAMELFSDFPSRLANHDALRVFLGEWIAQWNVDELFHKGQSKRICFAPVLTMEQLADQPHLQERDYFHCVTHPVAAELTHLGAPYRLRHPWWQIRRAAPTLDEHNIDDIAGDWQLGPLPVSKQQEGSRGAVGATRTTGSRFTANNSESGLPLAGVRVADFTWVWAGPYCAMQLAHLGAEVIKCESMGRPDLGRRLAVYPPDTKPGLNRSGYFNQWNQGKKSISLNLRNPASIAVAKELVAQCDVVVENFATGVMDRLGLGYENLCEVRPDLIYASISGYGDTGPLHHYMAYGPAISPLSGLSSATGYLDGPPQELGIALGDPAAGVTAAVAICAALAARQRSGLGQHIDVSLWEATAQLGAEGWMDYAMNGRNPERIGNRDPQMCPHGCFRCAGDDEWVTIACANDAEWLALCKVIGSGLAGDPRFASLDSRRVHEDALEELISNWTTTRDRWAITRQLQEAGVAAFPSMSPRDLVDDPHLASRGLLERLDHPEVGRRVHVGIPWRLTNGPNGVRSPAPQLGADTREVLGGILEYSDEKIDRLISDGVLE
jgi:crotonobetainyl-CoA:carnitine CoA-transferase CaiB-like acyl-CoA transferase